MMTPLPEANARLEWVPIQEMRVSQLAQRELKPHWVNQIVTAFDPELIGVPTVNMRDGHYYIIDGQHRVDAIRNMGWGDQKLLCRVYENMTESEEAEAFLRLNNVLTVNSFTKFQIAVQAGREAETAIAEIVKELGLRITLNKVEGAIHATGTLMRVYERGGQLLMARTLRVCRDAYGSAGLEAAIIDGIGALLHRYGDKIDEEELIHRLSHMHGGANGLLGKAEVMRRATGQKRFQCVAAAAVDVLNSGAQGGKRLPGWWKVSSRGRMTAA